jgi:maltose-binding protein MalE
MIWAHDRLGEWADAGLLLPIDPDPAFLPRIFPKAWEAFTHRGRLWGYPLAMESTGLIYNKALISEDEIPAQSRRLHPAGPAPPGAGRHTRSCGTTTTPSSPSASSPPAAAMSSASAPTAPTTPPTSA